MAKKVQAHIRKHLSLDEDGKVQIEETYIPEREMMPIDEYAELYADKMNIDLIEGIRIIHPDDFQCYELQNGDWVLITVDD